MLIFFQFTVKEVVCVKKIINKNAGLTLVELILAIAILGMIIIAFIPAFLMSAKTNNRAEKALESTYLGKDVMEAVYELSKTASYEELKSKLVTEKGYTKLSENTYKREISDNRVIYLSLTENDKLLTVVTKIYNDVSLSQLEVQYESLYFTR